MALTKPGSVVARICLSLAFASLTACAGETGDDADAEGETESSAESALSQRKQPKLEIKLHDAWTKKYEPAASAMCASQNIFAFAELRGEALNRTIADIVLTRLESGGRTTIASYEIPKEGVLGDLPLIPPPISFGSLESFEGRAFAVQIVQKRYGSGKVVGVSKSYRIVISRPNVELLSVADTSCPMGTCSAAMMRVRPAMAGISPSDYACSDLQLGLRYGSESDGSFQTMLKRQLTPGIVRGNVVTTALSVPFPEHMNPESAVVLHGSQVVSNAVSVP